MCDCLQTTFLSKNKHLFIEASIIWWLFDKVLYLFEIEEEAGVLAGFGEVGEKHCDTDEQHRGVLAHLTQRLDKKTAGRHPLKLTHS